MTMESLYESLKRSVEEYEPDKAKKFAKELLNAGADSLTVINEVLGPTMEQIGEKFNRMEIFLPELMVAAQAMQAATSILTEHIKETTTEKPKAKGKVVIGTVHGDIHEIGKDIVKLMLEVSGFEVFDLGKDVPSMQFIEKAEEVGADVIALSALMTTTMGSQKEVIELLEALDKRKNYVVIIGGAPTTVTWQKEIGADGWAETAGEVGKLTAKLIEERAK
ncbi:MAG: cobalamin-dependent protein [Candidatus Heimdallarchaeota archaeon]|nr:MAG: cobalamin-dependent protein [Candidatus Heimdallarchaeota archaeon]